MNSSSAIVTVVSGSAAEHLDYTFLSFFGKAEATLHAFIIGSSLPTQKFPQIHYHLVQSIPDFSDPIREVYFRRLLLIDEIKAEFVLVVDCSDVLCMQPLPPFADLLKGSFVGASTEHPGSRYLLGQGYTANYLNCGVVFWNRRDSAEMRSEIYQRGKRQFRAVVDDQLAFNEVLQTCYYDRIRILPCQYNYRCYVGIQKRGWPTVNHLDGVKIYHNGACIEAAKRLLPIRNKAHLPPLQGDLQPVSVFQQLLRRLKRRFEPHIVK